MKNKVKVWFADDYYEEEIADREQVLDLIDYCAQDTSFRKIEIEWANGETETLIASI